MLAIIFCEENIGQPGLFSQKIYKWFRNVALGIDFNHYFILKNVDPYDHGAACCVPLIIRMLQAKIQYLPASSSSITSIRPYVKQAKEVNLHWTVFKRSQKMSIGPQSRPSLSSKSDRFPMRK